MVCKAVLDTNYLGHVYQLSEDFSFLDYLDLVFCSDFDDTDLEFWCIFSQIPNKFKKKWKHLSLKQFKNIESLPGVILKVIEILYDLSRHPEARTLWGFTDGGLSVEHDDWDNDFKLLGACLVFSPRACLFSNERRLLKTAQIVNIECVYCLKGTVRKLGDLIEDLDGFLEEVKWKAFQKRHRNNPFISFDKDCQLVSCSCFRSSFASPANVRPNSNLPSIDRRARTKTDSP